MSSLNLSNSSNNEYFVTIDSEFRDNEKYPIETDFSVKFKTTQSNIPFVKGVPYIQTGSTGPVSNSFFTDIQIDPNYLNSDFRVLNGSILNLKKIDNQFIFCGIIKPFLTNTTSFTFNIQQKINNTYTNLFSRNWSYYFESPYLCKISLIDNSYVFDWIIFIDKYDTNNVNSNYSSNASFSFDSNNNIRFMFDFSLYQIVLNKISQSLTTSLIYNIENPSSVSNSCLAIFAFDINSNIYYVDGHPWGYHILQGNTDLLPTKSNGKNSIKVSDALDIYIGGNMNPFEPTYSYPFNTNGTSNMNYVISNRRLFFAFGDGTNNTISYSTDGINWTGIGKTIFSTSGRSISSNSSFLFVALGEGTNTLAYSYDGINWTGLGSSTFSSVGYDATWKNTGISSPTPYRCVAVGSGTNTIAYSDNGLSWTGLGSSIFSTAGYGIYYSSIQDRFVAVGQGTNTIAYNNYSDNSWWTATNGYFSSSGWAVAYSSSLNRWVAGGNGTNTFLYSTDGITWTAGSSISLSYALGIEYSSFQNQWIAVGGSQNTILYSSDGITWTGLGTSIFSTYGWGVAYSSTLNRWVAVGEGTNTIAYSTDGITWTGIGTSIFSTRGYGVAYSSTLSRWVAVGQGTNTIAYSTDGITWTGIGTSIFSSYGYGVAYSSTLNRWVAVGSGTNSIAYSTDGITWTGIGISIFSTSGKGVAYSSTLNRWVAVGSGSTNTIAYSTDGITWTGLGKTIFSSNSNGGGITYSSIQNRWVAVGEGTNIIAYSTDGISWTGVGMFTTRGLNINYSSTLNRWVAVGIGTNSIMYSTNGISWSGLGTSIFSTGYAVTYSSVLSRWVAVGQGTNTIAYSTDGITWTGIGTSIFSTSGRGIDYSSTLNRWVAVGEGTNTIAYSTDGISWTGIGTSIFSTRGEGIAYSSTLSRWVAVGQGTNSIAYSTDGITWIGIGTSIFSSNGGGVAYSSIQNRWVAVGSGSNGIAYSTDGITWTGLGSSILSTGRNVAYSSKQNQWVAVGQSTNTIAYSNDGITWYGMGNSIFSVGYGVAYSSTQDKWIVTGDGKNNFAYSSYGINFTGIGTSIFSTAGYGISGTNRTTGSEVYVAVGQGSTNTIATSSDGISWNGRGITVFTTAGRGVGYDSTTDRWIVVGEGGASIGYNSGSSSGQPTFSRVNNSLSIFTVGYSVAKNDNIWVALGSGPNTLAYSFDGLIWYGLGNTIFSNIGYGVTFTGTTTNVQTINIYEDSSIDKLVVFHQNNDLINGPIFGSIILYNNLQNNQLTYSSYNSKNYLGNINALGGTISTYLDNNNIYIYGSTLYMLSKLNNTAGSYSNKMYFCLSSINISTGVFTPDTKVSSEYNNSYNNYSSILYNNFLIIAFVRHDGTYTTQYLQIIYIDLTNIAAGFISLTTSSNFSQIFSYNDAVIDMIEISNVVYICITQKTGDILIYKATLISPPLAMTFVMSSPYPLYSNSLIENASLYLLNINCKFIYRNTNLYLVLGIPSVKYYIYGDLILNNLTLQSILDSLKSNIPSQVIYYNKSSNYYLLDQLGDIYNINDINNPILIYNNYPTLDRITLSKTIYAISSQYDKEFGNLIDTSKTYDNSYLMNFPFLQDSNDLNSIHYNQNVENQINNSNFITFDIVNQQSSVTSSIPTNTYEPSISIADSNVLPIIWFDASNTGSFELSETGTNDYIIKWNNSITNSYNFHLCSSGPTGAVYDYKNSEVILNNTYMEGIFGSSEEIEPKYMIVVSKKWNDLTIDDNLNCLVEIGNPSDKLGFYKYRNYNKNSRSLIASVPPTSQTYSFTGSSNPLLTDTGIHPYLYYENYNVNYNTSSTTEYLVSCGTGTNGLKYSSDGINWIENPVNSFTLTTDAAWNNTSCLVGGAGSQSLAYSTNGITFLQAGPTTTFSTSGYGVAYSSTLNRWVSVGEGTNTILYSTDGISWTGIGTSIFSTYGYGVAYSSILNTWVAVGLGSNTIAYSTDGISWTGIGTSIFSSAGFGVAYSSTLNRWVAVGQGANTIAYSTDGITWTGIGNSIFPTRAYGVAYSSTLNRWVAVGQGANTIAYSTDGITWTGIGNSIFSDAGFGVAYSSSQNRWVAVGAGTNTIAYSTDGINWIGNSIFSTRGYGVAYSSVQNRWIAVGQGTNTIAYSTDGITWTGLGSSIFSTRGYGVAYSSVQNRWIAVGQGTNVIVYSSDGINWNRVNGSLINNICYSIYYDTFNDLFLCGGNGTNNTIVATYNPTNSSTNFWYQGGTLSLSTCRKIKSNSIKTIAVGEGSNNLGIISISTNNTSYTNFISLGNTSTFSTGRGIVYSSSLNRWVAVGFGTNSIAYSTNGINWTGIGTSIYTEINEVYGISYSSTLNRWVSVGNGSSGGINTIAYSTDGINWTGLGKTIFSTYGWAVTYSSTLNRWVAVGDGSNTIAYSTDGITWTGLGNSIFSTRGRGIDYSSSLNRWVAVGQGTNTIAYSTDGITWTGIGSSIFSTSGFDVAYSSTLNRWVAVGNGTNTIAYSTDGITWTGIGSSIFSTSGYGVDYSSSLSRWVAVGQGTNTIAYSTDGITWTGIGTSIFSTSGRGIDYSSTLNRWVAVGEGTNTIAYSTDGITWTGIGTSIFSSIGWGVAYSSTQNQWIAVGSGRNNIAYSNDGITWIGIKSNTFIRNSGTSIGISFSNEQNQFISVGGTINSFNTIGYSTDGISWTGVGTSIFSSYGYGVAYSSILNRWVAVGSGTNTIAYSTDGITWTGIGTSIFSTSGFGVAYSSSLSRWVAVGQGTNTIAYSTDGITWTGIGTSIFSTRGYGVAYSSTLNRWVAVGQGTNTIAYSTDGISWTGIGTSIFSSIGWGVAYSEIQNAFVAVGQGTNTIAYSTDGITWTGLGNSIINSIGYGVSYSSTQNKWIVVGDGTVTDIAVSLKLDFTLYNLNFMNSIYDIIYIPSYSRWIIVGSGNSSIAYSDDEGLTWNPLGKVYFETACYSIDYNPYLNLIIACGVGNNYKLAYSYNGIDWTPISFILFDISCNNIKYNNIYNVWYLSGSNSNPLISTLAYSYDGLNWNYSSNNTKTYTSSSGFGIPLQNYPESYNKGIYELVYETQSNYSTFDGKFNFNNTNSNNDPVNSSGWNNVLTHLRVGKTSLSNTISKETVNFDQYTNQIIYVNGSTGSTGTIGNFSGTISEIIVYETVPDDTTKKQIQAYLAKKYNLWNVYGGVNPYKPDINYTTNMITVDGVNNTLNFLNINDISNINNYTLPISLFPRSSTLYSNIMSHGDIIDFKHIVYNNNIYLFILFTRATSSSSYIRYLVLYEFDLYYTLKYSTTIYTSTTTGASSLSPFPVNNVNVASKFFIPYIKNNNVLVAVNTTSSIIQIYSYIPNSYTSSTLLGSITLNLNISPYNGFLSAGEIINYGGTYIFYGIATVSNYPYTLNTPGLIGNLITYNISNETSPIELENSLPLLTLTIGTNRNGLKFFKYPDGLKYLFIRQTSGQDQTTVIDISDYNNLSYKNIIGWRHVPEFDYTNTTYIASFPNSDFEVPNSIYQNPVTKHIYMLSNYISGTGSNLPTTSNLYNFFSYRNITDLNDIQNSSPIPITSTNLGYRIGLIKHSYSGQKVYAAALVTDNSTINSQYIKFYDVSNVEYASTYYQNNNPFPEFITSSYTGLNGLGLGFIHKLSYKGEPQWLNYVGGDSNIYPSTNVNISNIDLNTDSSKLYLTGGWNNKIEAFNKDFTKVNQIYNINSGYNGFIGKITLDKGDYEWIVSSIGDNDDFYEKLSYIPSKDDICVIAHFESTTLLVYEPQNSSTGTFTNPSVVNLTLSNSSSESSSLISFNPSGTINYHTSIYSLLEAQSVKLYDLIYDEDTTKKRIYVIGTSNATLINSKDSTNLETQKLYNDIDQNNENSIIIYQYDLNGIYQSSQRITFPPDVVINVSDIKSFSLLNRIITFINLYSTNGTTTDTINIYNPDGTIGVKLVSSIDFVDNLNESLVVQYYYDNTFVDTNGNNYSRIIVLNPNLPTTENSLVNYNLFILGDLFDSTLYNETTQSLQSVSSLNKNFSIRSNFVNPTGNAYNIILNQLIDLTSLERKNLPNDDYWSGSVVKSTLTNIIAYDITLLPNVSNQLTITNIYGEPLDLTKQYYLIIPNNENITYVTVNSITYNSSSNTYFLNIDNLNDLLVNGQYYGPYVYLSTTNLNANYIIQFCPTPLNSESKFKIKLNSLIIPNRRIRNSYLGGSRDLNDFRYLVLEIYNENDVETYPDTINNNNFYNNPNYIGVSNRSIGSFTIPITGINVSSTSNFILLTSNDTPIVIFRPGFYNIHMKLKDLYGNVVQFDSTPEQNKSSDNIFINTTVDSPLLQIAANFTFTKV